MPTWWFALVLAGCWTTTPVVTPTAPATNPETQVVATPSHRAAHFRSPCELAIDRVLDLVHDEIDKVPDFADKLPDIRDASVASCKEMQWTDEAIRCFDDAVEAADLAPCQSKLTSAQTNDVMRRVTEATNTPTP